LPPVEPATGQATWIVETIRAFCASSHENTLGPGFDEPAWGEPLVAFARGDDPLFERIKQDIGDFYWTPAEAFALGHPQSPADAGELSIITWVLPQTPATLREQRAALAYPSERWSRVRQHGEAFNCSLRLHLVSQLAMTGIDAVAPERLAGFAYRQSPRFGIASNWSERHTAHIAGLGTFGLSDGLITPAGKAMRCGSVVARTQLPATPRPYHGIHDYCLWHARGSCGVCMLRCPVQAITPEGHDKDACARYIREVTAPYAREQFGVEATPCGLCQAAIPCETRIPPTLLKSSGGTAT